MKRILTVLFALVLVLSFTACAKEADKTTDAGQADETTDAGQADETTVEAADTETVDELDYPTKAIEITLPYPAGGGQDVFTRLVVKYMLKYLPEGSNVVVNNVTGGGGVVGATAMANLDNDGYSLSSIVPFQLTDQFVMNEIPYNEDSFIPLGVGSFDCNFLVVSTKLGVTTLEDFIALCKENPGEITMGMGGNWNVHDFFRLKLERELGVEFARVSFDGGSTAMTAVMSGDVDCSSASISEGLAAIEAGQVIPICVSTPERTEQAPDVPTLIELGYDIAHGQWRCISAPQGTDQAIQDYLADILAKVYNDEGWIEEAKQAGYDPVCYTGQDAKDYVSNDFEIYKSLINELGITPDYEL